MDSPICKSCRKIIASVVKIVTYQKKVGKKLVNAVEYYDEECFKKINKERARNEHRKEKRTR